MVLIELNVKWNETQQKELANTIWVEEGSTVRINYNVAIDLWGGERTKKKMFKNKLSIKEKK